MSKMSFETDYKIIASLIGIGFGIGWLAGLSISPVVSVIITSIVGVTVTLITSISGLEKKDSPDDKTSPKNMFRNMNINPTPIALLIVGIIIGTSVGIIMRNQNMLGTDLQSEIKKLEEVGIKKEDVVKRIFDREYPPQVKYPKNVQTCSNQNTGTFLFTKQTKECDRLLSLPSAELRRQLQVTPFDMLHVLPDFIDDDETLKKVVEAQCKELAK